MVKIIGIYFGINKRFIYTCLIKQTSTTVAMKSYSTFLLSFGLLLLSYSGATAQSVINVQYRPDRGLSDPELPDPRYAGAVEVNELKEKVQILTDAYSRLVEQHNIQADRLHALERLVRMTGPPPAKTLPNSVISIRKL
ncbi:hypothetical protein [Hymenobacter elongatus]|nr:hypothetical protein [Hymenobacter elongatus]